MLSTFVSNPDGPPLPFQLVTYDAWKLHGLRFKPGRATSPIPTRFPLRNELPSGKVSNPDGPPLPFQQRNSHGLLTWIGSFKPGRATSPIPTEQWYKAARELGLFQTRTGHLSHSNAIWPEHIQYQLVTFQTRTGHLSHSNPAYRYAAGRVGRGVSNPDGPPLPFQRISHQGESVGGTGFQTRTGHLSHSNEVGEEETTARGKVSNPDGPPLPFQPGT